MRLLNSFNLTAAQKLNSAHSWACTISLTTCQLYSCCSECRKFSHWFRGGGGWVEGVMCLAFFFFFKAREIVIRKILQWFPGTNLPTVNLWVNNGNSLYTWQPLRKSKESWEVHSPQTQDSWILWYIRICQNRDRAVLLLAQAISYVLKYWVWWGKLYCGMC